MPYMISYGDGKDAKTVGDLDIEQTVALAYELQDAGIRKFSDHQ